MVKLLNIAALTAGLVGHANAKWKIISADLKKLAKETDPDNRNLIFGSHANINAYGCWCYFDSQVGNGKGNPINLVDAECKILHGGYECIVSDLALLGIDCEPWTVTFLAGTGSFKLNTEGVVAACNHMNREGGGLNLPDLGKCAADACAVELRFTQALINLFNSITADLPQFSHAQGFNPVESCPIVRGIHDDTKDCCGDIPQRFPFKTLPTGAGARRRDCCNGAVYPTQTHKCCAPGVIKGINQSC
jgi:hypothetical protein